MKITLIYNDFKYTVLLIGEFMTGEVCFMIELALSILRNHYVPEY